ncbi:hypothetical protein PNI0006_01656 [Streptococcus pneumoniae PNI0006]|nr:hypothetical protein PNI0006_01656 [Streptococcus pneumoniae PNI0006]
MFHLTIDCIFIFKLPTYPTICSSNRRELKLLQSVAFSFLHQTSNSLTTDI